MSILPYRKPTLSPSYRAVGFGDFDRVFDNLLRNALTNISASSSDTLSQLSLKLDVSETPTAYIVKAELPGVDEKDIEVTLDEGLLTISGEKLQETEEDGKTFHRIERSFGSFKRVLSLPADADENGIEAHMKNGVLELQIAKSKQVEKTARRITVKTQ